MFYQSLLLLLLTPVAWSLGRGVVITAAGEGGKLYTVSNLFDGYNTSILFKKLDHNAQTIWEDRDNHGNEKIFAAVVDPHGNMYAAGVREVYGHTSFLAMKYASGGGQSWEYPDDAQDCSAESVAIDPLGGVVVAGICQYGRIQQVRVVKFDEDGASVWQQEYGDSRTARLESLAVSFDGHTTVSIRTEQDSYYHRVTIVYDPTGWQVSRR